jgi:hypothetical protein
MEGHRTTRGLRFEPEPVKVEPVGRMHAGMYWQTSAPRSLNVGIPRQAITRRSWRLARFSLRACVCKSSAVFHQENL